MPCFIDKIQENDKNHDKIPDASELLGEARERRMIIKYIDDLAKSCSNSDVAKAYKELSDSINNCEHY